MLQQKSRPKGRRQLIGRKLIKELFMNRVFAAKYNLLELKKHKDFLISKTQYLTAVPNNPTFKDRCFQVDYHLTLRLVLGLNDY